MNELYWIIALIISYVGVLMFYKFFGKVGLFVWIALATIVANIQAVKLVNLIGFETALGTIAYATTFLVNDILNEKYGRGTARKGIILGLSVMVTVAILMSIAILYTPSLNDFGAGSLSTIFTLNIRITIASIIAFVVSQYNDTWLYDKLKQKFKPLWIRNNFSTIISQLIDTLIFVSITYIGILPLDIVLSIGISMYVLKFITSLFDTPFMYIANKIKTNEI